MYDVILNGGGPVGTGLAIDCAQRGLRVALVERYPEPQLVPKGQNLTQRSLEHCRAWGCEAEMRTAHPMPPGAGIGGMTAYGTLLTDYHYDWLTRAAVKDYYACANARLPQYATERVLRARATQLDGIDIFYGWQGTGLTQDADGVTLEIEKRKGDGRKTLRGAYVVGCDGSRSMVRAAAQIPERLSDHNKLMCLMVFRSEELHALLERYPGKAFFCVLHPDFEGYWQFFGRVDHGLSFFFHAPVPLDSTAETVDPKAILTRAVGQDFAFEVDYLGFWDLRVSVAETYQAGRAFIAGDAAHSHPPYGGYGINTGFEDARNLAWKLAAVRHGWGGPGLLASYSSERQPVFASTARDFIENYIEEDRAFLAAHHPEDADFADRWYTRHPDDAEVNRFEPNYEGSPIIGGRGAPSAVGDHQFRARAGHHLSPAPLADGRGVYDVLGDGFTLLAADGADSGFTEAARALDLPLQVLPLGPDGAARLEASCVLVRPDHYVAWAGEAGDPAQILRRAAGWP